MRPVPTANLPVDVPLEYPIHHRSGQRLFDAGEVVSKRLRTLLLCCGIEEVWEFDKLTDHEQAFLRQHCIKAVPTVSLTTEFRSTRDIYSPDGDLQLAKGKYFTKKLIQRLREWGVEDVRVWKTDESMRLPNLARFFQIREDFADPSRPLSELPADLRPALAPSKAPAPTVAPPPAPNSPKAVLSPASVAPEPPAFVKPPTPAPPSPTKPAAPAALPPTLPAAARKPDTRRRNAKRKSGPHRQPGPDAAVPVKAQQRGDSKALFGHMYAACVTDVKSFWRRLEAGDRLDAADLNATIGHLQRAFYTEPDLFLGLLNVRKPPRDYLPWHAVHTAMLALAVARELDIEGDDAHDVGLVAMLHDLGMTRVANADLDTAGPLSRKARALLSKHPAWSLEMIEPVLGLPPAVRQALPQTHEREDGSGYPRGLAATHIHAAAKVVAVCDVYDALLSKRPWRHPLSPALALAETLTQARSGKLQPEVAAALEKALGRYPIGSWVELSDGAVAKVVRRNPQDPSQPRLARLASNNPRRFTRVDPSRKSGLAIARAVESFACPLSEALEAFDVG